MDWLAWAWNDVPTRLAVVALVVYPAISVGVLRWISRHYVGTAATGWRLTTWAGAHEAERTFTAERPDSRDAEQEPVAPPCVAR